MPLLFTIAIQLILYSFIIIFIISIISINTLLFIVPYFFTITHIINNWDSIDPMIILLYNIDI